MENAPEYSFPPVIKQPTIISYKIAGADAPRFVEELNKRVDADYKGNPNLKVLKIVDIAGVQTTVGSNTLIRPLVQTLVPSMRVGLPEDLQKTLNDGDTLNIRGNHYIDLGAVLDFSGNNHDLALDLFEQLPKELRDFERMPAVVVGYGLKNFDKGNYGVGLVYADGTQIRHSPILAQGSGNFPNEDVSLETGLPAKLRGGDRRLYTAPQKAVSKDNLGLLGLCLGGDLNVGSDGGGLADSIDNGRVVLVRDAVVRAEK